MNKKHIVIAAVIAAVFFSLGSFLGPKEVEIKEVEKIIYKESKRTDRNQNVKEIEKETRLPDGTIIKERIKTKETETITDLRTEVDKSSEKTSITKARPNWRLGLIYEPAIKGLQEETYTGLVERQILGEIYLGVSVGRELGLVFSIGF
jgi:hypothetical protein